MELLVATSIIALLMSALMPAMSACRTAARKLKCASQLRTTAFDFRVFVDDFPTRRGDETTPQSPMFRIEDFQESVYRVDEYWDAIGTSRDLYEAELEPMICPEGPRQLERRAGMPCSSGAVWPKPNVSMGFNMRLHRIGLRRSGRPVWLSKQISGRILNHPDVPLLLDVDGKDADAAGQLPYYVAPPTANDDLYQSGQYWHPSERHGGATNVALVDGSVHASRDPANEPFMRWTYEPD